PCPLAAEGIQGCIDRLWSNTKQRREALFDTHRRRFGRTVQPDRRQLTPPNPKVSDLIGREETTFGCRFYHGLALHSPCERDVKLWPLQLLVDQIGVSKPGRPDESGLVPLANRRFVAKVGQSPDAPLIRGRTTVNGVIGLPYFEDNVTIELKVDAFADQSGK